MISSVGMKVTLKISLAFKSNLVLSTMDKSISQWPRLGSLIQSLLILVLMLSQQNTKRMALLQLQCYSLQPDLDLPPFSKTWGYHSTIGELNFLAQNTITDPSFVVHHQYTKFCMNPREPHSATIKSPSSWVSNVTPTIQSQVTPICEGVSWQLVTYLSPDPIQAVWRHR
jgi:hypothetical protein